MSLAITYTDWRTKFGHMLQRNLRGILDLNKLWKIPKSTFGCPRNVDLQMGGSE